MQFSQTQQNDNSKYNSSTLELIDLWIPSIDILETTNFKHKLNLIWK